MARPAMPAPTPGVTGPFPGRSKHPAVKTGPNVVCGGVQVYLTGRLKTKMEITVKTSGSLLGTLLLVCSVAAAAPRPEACPAARVVRYAGSMNDVKYVYGVGPPVARLRQRHPEARRHAQSGQGRQPSHRPFLSGGR